MSRDIAFQFPVSPNSPVVLAVVVLSSLVEAALALLGFELPGGATLRQLALAYGAFWNGLLQGWEPLYPLQREAMFVTYALLHGGWVHLVGNMIAVLALGGIVVARIGPRGFLLLYVLTAVGGAAGFALLSGSDTPMIGASGAVFGLVGAWKFWEWQLRRHTGASMAPLWRSLLGLGLLNLVLWLALSGLLAWEAHLGGFVTGWLVAAIVTPTVRHRV